MPSRGRVEGGTAVAVTGSNFLPGARVLFGETEATQVVVVAQGRITAVTPPHRAGRVNVTVEAPGHQSGGRAWAFTYEETGGE